MPFNYQYVSILFEVNTRMRGKAQPDGRPAVELIETLVLVPLFSSCELKSTCITAS